jgi:heparan-alpha-glucosaminide N-acetyltransferase
VTSFSAVGSLYFGALIGHVFLSTPGINEPSERIRAMSYLGTVLLAIGTALSLAGIPFNKNLYSLSYMFFMAGWSTLFLLGFWYVIDVKQIEKPFLPLIWNGLNAIFLFVVGACDILERLIKKWYYGTNKVNIYIVVLNTYFC